MLLRSQPSGNEWLNMKVVEKRPKTATTDERIEKVHNIILEYRPLKVYEIHKTTGILEERIRYILHEELSIRKLCARSVPHLLNADKKQTRTRTLFSNFGHF